MPRSVSPEQIAEIDATMTAPEDVLRWALQTFGDRVALSSSFGAEDMVLIDMLCQLSERPRIFTLDTGRLPQETYDVIDAVRARYGARIEICAPQALAVEEMVLVHGPNLFFRSVELRKLCCHVRKVEPLQRALAALDAWISGLRRDQATTRARIARVEIDAANGGLVKINPLADWSWEQVWAYIRARAVPYNALHDQGYPSIGCAPCTRAVQPGEDLRAGRWWWERDTQKECGLHIPAPPETEAAR